MLSDHHIAQYHRDGYILIKNVFSSDEIAAFMASGRAHPAPEGCAISLFELDALKKSMARLSSGLVMHCKYYRHDVWRYISKTCYYVRAAKLI